MRGIAAHKIVAFSAAVGTIGIGYVSVVGEKFETYA